MEKGVRHGIGFEKKKKRLKKGEGEEKEPGIVSPYQVRGTKKESIIRGKRVDRVRIINLKS